MARWWVAGLVSVLARGAGAACPPAPAPTRPAATAHNLGLVVSGGVSEGSYQAGATYALLHHYLRHRAPGQLDLRLATGSSAGNINIVLASTYWLSARSLESARVMNNIFFDTWANVGWDRLAPVRNRASAYGALFSPALGGLPPGAPDLSGEAKGCFAPVYDNRDGLVTRHALDQGVANAKKHFTDEWRPGARLALGVTLTRESVDELKLRTSISAADGGNPDGKTVSVQRFAVPFSVETPASPAPGPNAPDKVNGTLTFKGAPAGWKDTHPSIGAAKEMPATIDADMLFNLVKAAKGFPVAFGPLHVPQNDAGPRFWDGGWFDNVPVGLARELNQDINRAENTTRPLAFMYIDALTQRGQPKPVPGRPAHGLSLVAKLAGARFNEARTYELQALSRLAGQEGPKGQERPKIQMTDRFFPLAANQLPLSFGAFLHADFRRYDYLVGLYDAVYALAIGNLAGDDVVPKTREEWCAFVARFKAELDDQFCGVSCPGAPRDEDERLVRAFLLHLLSDELQARAPAAVAISNNSAAPIGARDIVWDLHEELYEQSELRRAHLREGGDRVAEASLEANRGGMTGFFWNLPAGLTPMSPQQRVDARDDPNGFLVGEVDRLVRRQIDIENADEDRPDLAAGDQRLSKTFKDGLYYSRLVAPALLERSPTWIGDAGTATRLGAPAIISFLLPQYAANQVTTCQHEFGWEPKLRVGYRGREDGLRPWYAGPFLATQAALQWASWCSGGASWSRWRFGAGLGYDPDGRIIDDVQVLATTTTSQERFFRAGGVEGAVTFLTKLRVAVGSDGLWTSGGPGTLPHGFYVTLGLADLGGVATWVAQSLFRGCQHGCENEVAP